MKTAKIIIISSCAVGAILFLGAGFMLYRSVTDFNASKADLTKVKRSLDRYYDASIFPSLDNVKQELDNSQQADDWFGKLVSLLYKGNVNSSETSPTRFKNAANNARRNLDKKAREAGTEMPDSSANFAFGFERYAGTEGTLPQSADVARLIEQMVIINRISLILFDNNIKSLTSVKRDVFETSIGAPKKAKRPTRGARGRAGRANAAQKPSAAALANVGIIGSESLFAKMHFVFEFRAKEKALLDILNAFSTNKMFIVVTSVSLSKNTPPLVPAVVDPAAANGTDALAALDHGRAENTEDVVVERLGPNYPVCGIKMEIPLDIRIELDVYKFKEAGLDSGN